MLRQEFQAAIEGGVAGRDIRNEAPTLQIGGNVGAAFNVSEGTFHIHMGAPVRGNSTEQQIADGLTAQADTTRPRPRIDDITAKLEEANPTRPVCQTCSSAITSLARTRRGLSIMYGVAGVAILAAIYFGKQAHTAVEASKAVEAKLASMCELWGNRYRIGYQLEYSKGKEYRCIPAINGPAQWQEVSSKRK